MKKLCVLFLMLFISPVFASGIDANTNSAPCTNNTLETYSGNSNLQADWQPNTINLRWYNENERLTVQSSAQSCVYDGTLTIPSTQPTRTGYTFAGWEVKYTIPAGYTELEYLESAGTQYINTKLTVDNGEIACTAIFEPTNLTSPTGNPNSGYIYSAIFGRDSNFQAAYTPDGKAHIGNQASSDVFFAVNTKVKVSGVLSSNNANPYYVNDTPTGLSRIFASSHQLFLFSSEATRYGAVGRLYNFVAERNNEKIMHLVPARRNSDNILGMYDTVTQTFFTNSGTGSFIAGPVVQ